MHDPTNAGRADRAGDALAEYTDRNDPHTDVSDMLANLRHFCDVHGVDFDRADRMAYDHYRDELQEERDAAAATHAAGPAETYASRSLHAIEAARFAFWSTLAECYPEADTGDVAPAAVDAFDRATMAAGSQWIADNARRRYVVATVHVITGDNPTDAWETFTGSERAAGAVFLTGPCRATAAQLLSEDFDVDVKVAGEVLPRAVES